MTLRQLARGSLLYGIGQMLPRVGLFLLVPFYIRAMSAAEFGLMMLIVSVGSLLGIVFRFGLDGALLRIHFDLDAAERGPLYWTTAAIAVAGSAVVMLLLIPAAAPNFSRLFAGADLLPFGALAAALGITNGLQFIPAVWYRASESPGRYLVYTSSVLFVSVVASLVLVGVLQLGAVGALLGWIAGGLVTLAFAAKVLLGFGRVQLSARLARDSLSYGIPLIPHSVSAWVLNVSDRVLIGLLIGLPPIAAQAAIGRYALGYQVAYVVSLAAMAMQYALSPYLFRTAHVAGFAVYRELVTIGAVAVLSIAAFAVAAAPEIVGVLAPGSEYGASVSVLRVAAAGTTLYGFYALAVPVLLYQRRTRTLAALTVSAGLVNVVVNLTLIPSIGILGAAVATVAAYGAYASATVGIAHMTSSARLDIYRLVGASAVALVLIGLPAWLDEVELGSVALRYAGLTFFLVLAAVFAWSAVRRAMASEAASD